MQYYGLYTLGYPSKNWKATYKGTIVHKVLEICGACKKALQEGLSEIHDSEIGTVETDRVESEYLEEIIYKVYQYYIASATEYEWDQKDYRECQKGVWKTLEYQDGLFDPRNRNIVDVEPHFNFEIQKDWAAYDYSELGLKGHLAMKGTIDLVTDIGDGVYEVVDYKTGKRTDWATGKLKTQETLPKDPQLRMYHYAVKQMYPDVHTLIITIFFINHGGPFSVYFTDDDLEKTEKMIQKKFEHIRDTKEPATIRQKDPKQGWKCRKFCSLGMNTFEGTQIKPLKEGRSGQYTRYGEVMSQCEQLRYMIKKKGIEWVTENMINQGHSHGFYAAPGAVEDKEEEK